MNDSAHRRRERRGESPASGRNHEDDAEVLIGSPSEARGDADDYGGTGGVGRYFASASFESEPSMYVATGCGSL